MGLILKVYQPQHFVISRQVKSERKRHRGRAEVCKGGQAQPFFFPAPAGAGKKPKPSLKDKKFPRYKGRTNVSARIG
jgi:hypothetical protein